MKKFLLLFILGFPLISCTQIMPMMIQSMAPHHGKIKRAPHKVVKQKKSKDPTSVEKEVLSMVTIVLPLFKE